MRIDVHPVLIPYLETYVPGVDFDLSVAKHDRLVWRHINLTPTVTVLELRKSLVTCNRPLNNEYRLSTRRPTQLDGLDPVFQVQYIRLTLGIVRFEKKCSPSVRRVEDSIKRTRISVTSTRVNPLSAESYELTILLPLHMFSKWTVQCSCFG